MKKPRIFTVIGLAVVFLAVATVAGIPAFKHHAELVTCSNQMHGILFVSTLVWPGDHDGQLPSNFLSMSNELCTPKFLICPGDHGRQPAASWASFTTNNCSYEMVAPGIHKADTNAVVLRCKIHGYVGYADDRLLDASGRLIRPGRFW